MASFCLFSFFYRSDNNDNFNSNYINWIKNAKWFIEISNYLALGAKSTKGFEPQLYLGREMPHQYKLSKVARFV